MTDPISPKPSICASCDVEMQPGYALEQNHGGLSVTQWITGVVERGFLGWVRTANRKKYELKGYRCPACGHVEFYATDRIYA